MSLTRFYPQIENTTGADKEIPFGDGVSLTQNIEFQWHSSQKIMTIGDFSATDPFEGTRYLDKGIHIRNSNPALVIEDTGATNPISLQAGAAKKVYLREERASPDTPIDIMTVDNSDNIDFPNAPKMTIGNGSSDNEIVLLSRNNSSAACSVAFYETTYENNGVQMCYDSQDNCLDFYDWSGGIKRAIPIMSLNRTNEYASFENLGLLERSSDPGKPPEGESVVWLSDGTGFGSDGDIIAASTAGGTTRRAVIFNHSSGSVW